MSGDHVVEKVKGVAKEAAGKAVGSDELAQEGEAQQKKAITNEEAEELERQAAAKRAEAAGHAGEEARHQG